MDQLTAITTGRNMIITSLMGGLGNQMFQYATAKHLSIINNTDLRIDASNFRKLTSNREHNLQLTNFNISAQQATRSEILGVVKPINFFSRFVVSVFRSSPLKADSKAIYREPGGSDFKPCILQLSGDRYLIGYFNSYKYFEKSRNYLIDEYKPREAVSLDGQKLLKLIESTNSISIHIRRGDYVNDPGVYKCIEGIITDRFYHNAIDLIASKVNSPHFFVFSNDMQWVKTNFKIPFEVTFVDINSPQRGFEDLWLMSRCKHNITAGGSTFSWWAAYLNLNPEKIVVRTDNISNEPIYNHPEDYFPAGWASVKS